MKTTIKKKYLIFAAAALTLAACSNDDENLNGGPVELRLSSSLEVQTRANTQATAIAKDEVVSVWVDDAGNGTPLYKAYQLKADGANGLSGTPMYFPQTGNDVDIYTMHGNFTPTFATDEDFPTESKTFTVASDQSEMGTSYTNSDLLYAVKQDVARTPENVNLTFYHMLSKIEVAVVVGDGAPALAADNAISIGNVITDGTFKPAKISETEITDQAARAQMITAGSTSGNIILGQETCTDFSGNVVYNEAVIVPQNMGGKTISFNLASGGVLKYNIPSTTIFESSKKYRYHITMRLSDLSVAAEIVDWDDSPVPEDDFATMD